MGENIANNSTNKGFKKKKQKQKPNQKMGQDLNGYFSKEDIQMAKST